MRGTAGGRRWRVLGSTTGLAALLLAACTVPPPPGPPTPTYPTGADAANVALSILPPGNGNITGTTTGHQDDQRLRYETVDDAVANGTLSDANLADYFKDAGFGLAPDEIEASHAPRDGVEIFWDTDGVPHVYGETAVDVAFGAGWAVADSRFLIAEIMRLVGRLGIMELAGDELQDQLAHLFDSPAVAYTDAELEAQVDRAVAAAGADGPALRAELEAYVDGINGYLAHQGFVPQDAKSLWAQVGLPYPAWTTGDLAAAAILMNDVFGAGGGAESCNAISLRTLVERHGFFGGLSRYADLRMRDNPESTFTAPGEFPYPLFDRGDRGTSLFSFALPEGEDIERRCHLENTEPRGMSNYLVVGSERSADGHPILVGGPQTGHVFPSLLLEMELHGGGFSARGLAYPGLGPYFFAGRTGEYAWSLTSGFSDFVDERVEVLCDPNGGPVDGDETHYRFRGRCRAMEPPNPDVAAAVPRTVHGPVVARGHVDGKPVAISRERLSRGHELTANVSFRALVRGHTDRAREFAPTLRHVPMSFNFVYANADDIAYFHSGWYPVRRSGAAYDLPTWGTGHWEWKGRVDWRQQPQAIDPASGYFVSWNNRPASGWSMADNFWGDGGVNRVDLIDSRVGDESAFTPASAFSVVQEAATADLRGQLVVPEVVALLEGTDAPNDRAAAGLEVLADWSGRGAHRRDRDDDKWYEEAGVAINDRLWERLVHAVYDGDFGDPDGAGPASAIYDRLRPTKFDDGPSIFGSSFQFGWYSLVERDLRALRTGDTSGLRAGVRCGDGALEACRAALWEAVDGAVAAAGPRFVPPDRLRKLALFERISFIPFLFNPNTMRWSNRPTFQQIVGYGS